MGGKRPSDERLPSRIAASLARLARRCELEQATDIIVGTAAPCYALVIDDDRDAHEIGRTRIGGEPDLPIEMGWPTATDDGPTRFANFIAQINFADLPPVGVRVPLPEAGMLYIFVRRLSRTTDPVELSVLFWNGSRDQLQRRTMPPVHQLCDERIVGLRPIPVRAQLTASLPLTRSDFVAALASVDPDHEKRAALDGALRLPGQLGQLLGLAYDTHHDCDPYRLLALTTLGRRDAGMSDYWRSVDELEVSIERALDDGDSDRASYYESMRDNLSWLTEHRALVEQGARSWRLLARIDSGDATGLRIHEADPLYTYIRNQDLARRDFSMVAGELAMC